MHLEKPLFFILLLFVLEIICEDGFEEIDEEFPITWNGDDLPGPWNDVNYRLPEITSEDFYGNVPYSKLINLRTTQNGSTYDIETFIESRTRVYPASFSLFDTLVRVSIEDATGFNWLYKVDPGNSIVYLAGEPGVYLPYKTCEDVEIDENNLDILEPINSLFEKDVIKPNCTYVFWANNKVSA